MKMKKGPLKITKAQKTLPANLQKAIVAKEKKEGKASMAKMKKAAMKMKDAGMKMVKKSAMMMKKASNMKMKKK